MVTLYAPSKAVLRREENPHMDGVMSEEHRKQLKELLAPRAGTI